MDKAGGTALMAARSGDTVDITDKLAIDTLERSGQVRAVDAEDRAAFPFRLRIHFRTLVEMGEGNVLETDHTALDNAKSAVTVVGDIILVDIPRKDGRIQGRVTFAQVVKLQGFAVAAPDAEDILGNLKETIFFRDHVRALLDMDTGIGQIGARIRNHLQELLERQGIVPVHPALGA